MKTVLSILLVLILLGVGAGVAAYRLNTAPGAISEGGVIFEVSSGETLSAIASRLEGEQLIRSRYALRVVARLRGTEASLKAGFYRIIPGSTTVDVHDLLVAGRQDEVQITIPEGWTARQIAEYLEAQGVASAEGFLDAVDSAVLAIAYGVPGNSLEGYLFPDTYRVSQNMPERLIAKKMVDTFFSRFAEIAPEYEELDAETLRRKVILASVVEREYRVAEEAPYIASVFYNRLKYNIGLESCATIAYIITEVQGKPHPEQITRSDLKIDSKFNTYLWAGYPPAPISNPGTVALEAVFRPAVTDYYYFLLKDPAVGSHYFSGDLDEHNQAKRYYIKGVGS